MRTAIPQPDQARTKVMVVDDEPQILTTIQDLLEDDFAVVTTTSGEAALGKLRENGVAVILSDQRMPGLSGDEFLQRARVVSGATRLLITGYSDWDALVRAVNDGKIYSYVQKPWDPADLKMKVAKAAEHYQLQIELARERYLLHALMDGMPDTIFFKDTESRFVRINPSMARLLGVSSCDEATGKSDPDFLAAEFAAASLAEEREIIRSARPVKDKVEKVPGTGGQGLWYSTTKVPIIDSQNRVTGLIGISRDITERKLAEELMIRHAEELERFAFIAAHDLQEPLRTVSTFAQILSRRYREKFDAEADQYLDFITGAASRMRELIQALLEYARVGRHERKFQPTDCNAALQDAQAMLRAAIEQSGAVVSSGPLPTINADSVQIVQLFQNLLSNAVKFCGGAPPHVYVTAELSNGAWEFSVQDTGIGIDSRYTEQIFRVFERLHRADEYPGTGIGLALCKTIVERHGGRIWVESAPGKGANFRFLIPVE
jgi:PAS domain S-box-containing protein